MRVALYIHVLGAEAAEDQLSSLKALAVRDGGSILRSNCQGLRRAVAAYLLRIPLKRKESLESQGGFKMRKVIGLLLLTFAVQPLLAKENWPLTVTVLSTKNIEDPHGSFHLSWGGGSGGSSWNHRVHEDAFVEADNGNSYDLTPKNLKDMLLPGTYKAKIEKRDMEICEPKDNGKCREVKFWITGAVPTVNTERSTNRVTDQASQASVVIDSIPSNADIEIDGAFVGNTPSTFPLSSGNHQIVVKRKGFANWSKTISVNGGTIHLNAELEQEQPKQ